MKKAMEFWIYADRGGYWATTIMPRPVSRAIHVREVLDPDPKDEVIKTMREAIKISIESRCEGCGLTEINCDLAEALAAVEKLEK